MDLQYGGYSVCSAFLQVFNKYSHLNRFKEKNDIFFFGLSVCRILKRDQCSWPDSNGGGATGGDVYICHFYGVELKKS